MTKTVTGRRAFVLGLVLLTGGCAGNGLQLNPDDLYDAYDSNNDNSLSQAEWDQGYWKMDANGDGFVSPDEFNAAFGGGPGGP